MCMCHGAKEVLHFHGVVLGWGSGSRAWREALYWWRVLKGPISTFSTPVARLCVLKLHESGESHSDSNRTRLHAGPYRPGSFRQGTKQAGSLELGSSLGFACLEAWIQSWHTAWVLEVSRIQEGPTLSVLWVQWLQWLRALVRYLPGLCAHLAQIHMNQLSPSD